jgi:hypothetical protein
MNADGERKNSPLINTDDTDWHQETGEQTYHGDAEKSGEIARIAGSENHAELTNVNNILSSGIYVA